MGLLILILNELWDCDGKFLLNSKHRHGLEPIGLILVLLGVLDGHPNRDLGIARILCLDIDA